MIRVLYAGSPAPSAKTLSILYDGAAECGCEVAGVLTNEAKPRGRHKELLPTPVAEAAAERGIPLFTPARLDAAAREEIAKIAPDVLVCFAYGRIFGPKFLALFKCGGVNLHPSLLPKYRGPTPVNAAILNRDDKTAVTVQTLSLGMDEGEILAQEIIDLNGTETAGTLLDLCAERGAELLKTVLASIAKNGAMPKGRAQTGEPSYTSIIKKEDCRIDWKKSAEEIDAQIRAYSPEPGAWTTAGAETLRIAEAHIAGAERVAEIAQGAAAFGAVIAFDKSEGILIKTGRGILAVTKLQKQGKKIMDAPAFMNGARNFVGTTLE